jgi:hypothetical protein
MRLRFLCLFLVLLCAGCASKDASNREPFRSSVGQTVALDGPMLLTERCGYLFGGGGVLSLRPVRYGLVEPGRGRPLHIFSELPSGYRLTIDAVREEDVGDNCEIVVYGRTNFPATGKEVTFAYDYAGLPPLPWEQ